MAGPSQQHEESIAIRRPIRPAQPAPKDGPRTNEEIRVREVQLIDQTGTNVGVGYSLKPVNPEDLLRTVAHWVATCPVGVG